VKIETVIVDSLSEYMDYIGEVALKVASGKNLVPVLWFRGMSDVRYSLVTTSYREKICTKCIDDYNYSEAHYDEDICTQHYIAKNYHFFAKNPVSRTEWLEVMQHHGMRSRLLDWSESSIHSLLFSIESFLDNKNFHRLDRDKCVPCVWILEPAKLNQRIYKIMNEKLVSDVSFIKKLLKELEMTNRETNKAVKRIQSFFQKNSFHIGGTHLNGIYNLSEINNEIFRDRQRLRYMILNGESVNPFFYLLSRIYSDGYILGDRILPPLATVQSYHSERIKAQRGVFTVFPFYDELPGDTEKKEMKINPDAMENNECAPECLRKIIVNNPQKIAWDLLANGMDNSWLYPEMPIVSNVLTNRKIYY